MLIHKCCWCLNLRCGLLLLALLELILSCVQFSYFKCEEETNDTKGLLATTSVVGIVASCLLLYGVIAKARNGLYVHMIARLIEMAISIVTSIYIFMSIEHFPDEHHCNLALPIFLGILLLGRFLFGFYFFCCVYSFYKQAEYDDIE